MTKSFRLLAAFSLMSVLATPLHATGLDLSRDDVSEFVARMETSHGIPADETRRLLGQAEIQPRIIEAMSRPAEKVKPWHEYRQIFITDKRIRAGVDFWSERESDLERIAAETGVPAHIIVGILGVETFYGRITGKYRVIDSLVTLAFEYPPRSKFFTSELEQFLLLAQEQDLDVLDATGSYAGAMGGPQFISSSYRAYAVDASGDGQVNLWTDWTDIIGSVANYFAEHGWQPGGPVADRIDAAPPEAVISKGLALDKTTAELRQSGLRPQGDDDDKVMVFSLEATTGPEYWIGYRNFYVITRYNRSSMYAMAVYELGQEVRSLRETSADGS